MEDVRRMENETAQALAKVRFCEMHPLLGQGFNASAVNSLLVRMGEHQMELILSLELLFLLLII